jgi:hypothetical protein
LAVDGLLAAVDVALRAAGVGEAVFVALGAALGIGGSVTGGTVCSELAGTSGSTATKP